MKEIIYLDNTLVNSYLAQFDEGLISKLVNSLETNLIESEEDGKSNNLEANAGLAGITSIGANSTAEEKRSTTYSKMNSESQETAFHDFALDLLLNKINHLEDTSKKDFLSPEGRIRLYNFSRLESIMQRELVTIFDEDESHNKMIQSQINTIKQSSTYNGKNKTLLNKEIQQLKSKMKPVDESKFDNFDKVRRFGKLGNALYPDSCLVKIENNLLVCQKNNFRVNEASLTLLNETHKTAKCLAIFLYERSEGYIKENADGNIEQLEVETIAASAPTMMMDILLENFQLSTKGDIVARPVAIYFE